ncbi:hypothetical protein [Vibrio ziniensis]|uniref:J domain-containing protein n=1 Tax=Vibrio ziniensis TaxID=2711221 RepID=A0A6G7CLV6_9VIBR|nr:hypothetical protein [Vibrio ziniensis]QIH43028.1 hypothetical protein G5S32_14210 [Vibrio ziniensis]
MLIVSLLAFSSPLMTAPLKYFSDDKVGLYLMLIISAFIIIAFLFFKAREHAETKRHTRIKNEKIKAYKLIKSYSTRLEALNKEYELEKKKVVHANEIIKHANLRIACLSAGLNNQTPIHSFDFFEDLQTVDQIKKRYKLLSTTYHPDRGGNKKTMQLINDQYRQAFKYR